MSNKLRYRLGIDLGTTSLGSVLIRLNEKDEPIAIIRAGVRIFPDGREAKTGTPLAMQRRQARAARRRRDRFLQRKNKMIRLLIEYGFFPTDETARKKLINLNPYKIRAEGLDKAISKEQFGRALFHLNQRRGFKSNRKADSKASEDGVMKIAINELKQTLQNQSIRTLGEYLYKKMLNREPLRARLREKSVVQANGKNKIEKKYDVYASRDMIEHEFNCLWETQRNLQPKIYTDEAYENLKHTLLFQRELKPTIPGRCSLLPNEMRAPKALPSWQLFRIYQEVNHLGTRNQHTTEKLTLEQRNTVVSLLNSSSKKTFTQIRKSLQQDIQFTIEDEKRNELDGNKTAAILSKDIFFGKEWFKFTLEKQDEIVLQLLNEQNEDTLIQWLLNNTNISEDNAIALSNLELPDGYGSLCQTAIKQILTHLQKAVITYDEAVRLAGYESHSALLEGVGEHKQLPYYGKALQRHVAFGTGIETDLDEIRYGKIANPTVHLALNQVKVVINEYIKRYGQPQSIVVEMARDLKNSNKQKERITLEQAINQKRNALFRTEIAEQLELEEYQVKRSDIEKMILWSELSSDPLNRLCPYTGKPICKKTLLSSAIEIDHILPFSQTLDDSLNNKVVCFREANRYKTNNNPYDAFGKKEVAGFDYDEILARANKMRASKAYRFYPDGMKKWLQNDKDFLARSLNDTRYISRIAKEYLKLVCKDVQVIPGNMTSKLRHYFGLNDILSEHNIKNREDHRHHAIDACVIGVTNQSLLQKFANANKRAGEQGLEKLITSIEKPWPSYKEHVARAIQSLFVSFKPDHGYQGAMHNDTAYGLREDGFVHTHKPTADGAGREKVISKLNVIPITNEKANHRHGLDKNGNPKAYKGYKGDSNYCIEIFKDKNNKWISNVVTRFDAYQIIRKFGTIKGWEILSNQKQSLTNQFLIMRLIKNDIVRFEDNGLLITARVTKMIKDGRIYLAPHNEANVDARDRDKDNNFKLILKTAIGLQKAKGRKITISPIGIVNDPGFKD